MSAHVLHTANLPGTPGDVATYFALAMHPVNSHIATSECGGSPTGLIRIFFSLSTDQKGNPASSSASEGSGVTACLALAPCPLVP